MALTDILQSARLAAIGAGSLLSPTSAQDVVAVLNAETYEQVFSTARPMEANVYEAGDLMEHPLEDGATIADHRVIRSVEIDLPVKVAGADYRDAYDEIRQLWLDCTLLTVQTRTRSYTSMLIERMPHKESADGLASIDIDLRLKEARFVEPAFGDLPPRKVAQAKHSSTKKKGTAKTTKAPAATTAKAVPVVKAARTGPRTSTLAGLLGL